MILLSDSTSNISEEKNQVFLMLLNLFIYIVYGIFFLFLRLKLLIFLVLFCDLHKSIFKKCAI